VYARLAVLPPKRRITVSSIGPTSLLSDSAPTKDLEVRYHGQLVQAPYYTSLFVRNTGRHAITTAMFDQGRSLTIDLGAKVMHAAEAEPGSAPVRFSATGSTIAIGPDLIKRGDRVALGIVTEGQPRLDRKSMVIRDNLVDTTVRYQQPGDQDHSPRFIKRLARVATWANGLAALAALAAVVATWIIPGPSIVHEPSYPQTNPYVVPRPWPSAIAPSETPSVVQYECPDAGPASAHVLTPGSYWQTAFIAKGASITGGWLLATTTTESGAAVEVSVSTNIGLTSQLGSVDIAVNAGARQEFTFRTPLAVTPGTRLYLTVVSHGAVTVHATVNCLAGHLDGQS
jgi:hypothetical protein